jgi:hypothetical protein
LKGGFNGRFSMSYYVVLNLPKKLFGCILNPFSRYFGCKINYFFSVGNVLKDDSEERVITFYRGNNKGNLKDRDRNALLLSW